MTQRDSSGRFLPARQQSSDVPVPVADKPLTQAQVKNLREIVQGDMQTLIRHFEQDLDRRSRERYAAIEAQFGAVEGYEEWREKFKELAADFQAQARALMVQCREAGFEPRETPIAVTTVNDTYRAEFWRRQGAQQEKAKVNEAVQRIKSTVRSILANEQAKIDRQILMQSLPGGPAAFEILQDIPTAEDLWTKVKSELESKDADLLAAFVGQSDS